MSTEDNKPSHTKLKKVKTILITQPKPDQPKSGYFDLEQKYKIRVDFRKFVDIEGASLNQFRKTRINPLEYSALIFTSQLAITHYFRICEELKIKMPAEMKYFCSSEAIALYLQRFIEFRKRKVFYEKTGKLNLNELLLKHKAEEKFLFLCADSKINDLLDFLKLHQFNFDESVIYNVINSDLSDLKEIKYDMLVFFTPLSIRSLYSNFPDWAQNDTLIATFGEAAAKVIEERGLRLDIRAPTVDAPSMPMAIENYLKISNK
jgi:uroporphyrinogen-III synthase